MDFVWLIVADVVGLWLGILVSIGAQALMAYLLDMAPRTIVMGWGPVLLHPRLGRVRVILKALPFDGWVSIMAPIASVRLRMALVSSSGIVANIAASGIIMWIMMRQGNLLSIWIVVAFLQLWFAGWAAFPYSSRKKQHLGSNGLQFFRAIFGPPRGDLSEVYSKLLHQYQGTQQPSSISPEFREILFQIGRHDKHREVWSRRDACKALRDVLTRDSLSSAERLLVIDHLIFDELSYRDTGVTRAELDDWSRGALALYDAATTRVTRGAVLVRLGEFTAARDLLLAVLKHEPTPADAMVSCAFLAEAAAKEQDVVGAQNWSSQARAHIPADQSATMLPVLQRLERAAI